MEDAGDRAPGERWRQAAIEEALGALWWHWGDAYDIGHDERGWQARRRDGLGGDLTAPDPDALYGVIGADYALRPVPRGAAPAEGS